MKVIVDCDTGNDDAWAIFALLRSEERFKFNVIAITCVHGNCDVHNSVRNTLKVLEVCNRSDIPVFAGARSHLIYDPDKKEEKFHGDDGFSGVYDSSEKPSYDLVQKKHAVEAIRDYIEENPDEIVIIATAPLTNIALLYKLYPDVIPKIKSLHIMGGNHLGVGNITRHAEFNFYSDPEAAHIVFADTKCPIYVFPWEPCVESSVLMPFEEFRINVLSSNDNIYTKFLDPIEKVAYKGWKEWMPCDLFLAVTFIFPEIIKRSEEHHITIELAGTHTRAMMVMDHLKKQKPNATIIKEIDTERFKNFLKWICNHTVDEL
ncbi:pyrimidine-specific ribonucleoside hydrolase RihA-like [Chironomus tepperi]|uniref:pyrimidine-specific ribonucleoside hydrolase RihA-like n=1 Tax=Chironomus tepperi TaxID=113505 RepID=UPI00391EF75E